MDTIMEKLIVTGFEYLKDRRQKEELQRLRDIKPKIQAVVALASSTQSHIRDQNSALHKWMWQLRDAVDEADDVLDDFEYMMHEEQLMTRNKEETKVRCIICHLFECALKIGKRAVKFGLRALNFDPNLKRLEEVVHKLDKVSAEGSTFLPLLESAKQEQQRKLYRTRLAGSWPTNWPTNDLFVRGKEKGIVLDWLIKEPSNEEHISLLSIVGHGGMGKTTLLRHVFEDEATRKFDLKMWVCVSIYFDAKKVIFDMLQRRKTERPPLETLAALQGSLKSLVMRKKFLLVLDDIWDIEEEERNKGKWEDVLYPLVYGGLGSKILLTTRMDSGASMIAKVIREKKTLRLEGLKTDDCLLLLNSHAFANVENSDDHKNLRSIAGVRVKRLLGSPLAAKVIGDVLNSSLDERHWRKVLSIDFIRRELGQNDILRLSYTFLPKFLQNCCAFCCIFPQDHWFDEDDLVRMWIASGLIQSPHYSREALEDIGGRYVDVLVKKLFFDKFPNRPCYKMHALPYMVTNFVNEEECIRVVEDEELPSRIPETIRHLSIKTSNLKVLKNIKKFKKLRTLFLTYKGNQALVYKDNQNLVEVFAEIFEALRSIRSLYIYAEGLKMIPEAIGYLKHLRYLKLDQTNVVELPKSLSKLYHLQFLIYDTDFWYVSPDILPSNMSLDGLMFDSS